MFRRIRDFFTKMGNPMLNLPAAPQAIYFKFDGQWHKYVREDVSVRERYNMAVRDMGQRGDLFEQHEERADD